MWIRCSGSDGSKSIPYIYKDGQLGCEITKTNFRSEISGAGYVDGYFDNNGSRIAFVQYSGAYGQTTFITDEFDITDIDAITFNSISTSALNNLYLGVTNDFKEVFPAAAYVVVNSQLGAHSVNVSSLTGKYRVFIILNTANTNEKYVSMDAITFT